MDFLPLILSIYYYLKWIFNGRSQHQSDLCAFYDLGNVIVNKYETDSKYLGFTLDAELLAMKDHWYIFDSKKFQILTANLGHSYLRMGGTAADMVIFEPSHLFANESFCQSHKYNRETKNFTMLNKSLRTNCIVSPTSIKLSIALWDKINYFMLTLKPGWEFIYGLNAMLRNSKNGSWDPSNAIKLLEHSYLQHFRFHLELGNEPGEYPGVFKTWISPQQLANDFTSLKLLLETKNISRSLPVVIGPDLDGINDTMADQTYFSQFLEQLQTNSQGMNRSTPILDRISWHHYYISGPKATMEKFINADILDSLIPKIDSVNQVVQNMTTTLRHTPVWLGEGSNAWSSGAPNISDRYIAGFMFLDKLGQCAMRGLKVFIRQSLYMGHYALIGLDLNPNPDYYIAVLFKRLVGHRVIVIPNQPILCNKAKILSKTNTVRMYAHCAKNIGGGIIFYVMNLNNQQIRITFNNAMNSKMNKNPYFGHVQHKYLLTPVPYKNSTHKDKYFLLSRQVKLNGKPFQVSRDGKLPTIAPEIVTESSNQNIDILLPPYSFGFYIYPKANLSYCF